MRSTTLRLLALAVAFAIGYWLLESAISAREDAIGFWQSVRGDVPSFDLLHRILVALIFILLGAAGSRLVGTRWQAQADARESVAREELLAARNRETERARREWVEAFDAVLNPIVIHDGKGRILQANRAYRELADIQGRLRGRHYWEAFPLRDDPLPNCCPDPGNTENGSFEINGRNYINRTFAITEEASGQTTRWALVIEDITEQVRADRALSEREALIKAIYEGAKDVSFIVTDLGGEDARVLEFSPGAERMFCYRREEMIGQPVRRIHTSEDITRIPAVMATMAEHRAGFSAEGELVRRGGERFPVLFTAYPLLNEHGEMTAAISVAIDITAHKKSAEALRRANDELEAVFGSIQVLIAVLDTDFVIQRVNVAFANMAGKPPQMFQGLRLFDCFPQARCSEAQFRNAIENGEPVSATNQRYSENDQTSWWDWTLVPLKSRNGSTEGLVLTATDVTDKAMAMAALRTSEERFVLAMAGANEGLWDCNLLDGSVYVSSKWREVLGVPEYEQDPGFDFWQAHLHPDDRDHVVMALNEFINSNRLRHEISYRVIHPEGERWILDRALAVRDETEGKALRLVGASMDITERKRAQSAVEALSRVYGVLSAVNHAIVRIPDREPLLDAICRIVVERGGFQLCWIGFKQKAGRTQSAFGRPRDAIDTAPSRAAIDKAMRTGHYEVINASAADSFIPPICAMAAFPIREKGTVTGVLATYATDNGSFDEQRVSLLASLADDVSFALDNLAREAARVAAEAALQQAHADLEQRVRERTAELEEMNRQLESFSYSVSHDLRGPLRAINGFASVLMEDHSAQLDGKANESLCRIRAASNRMANLIDGLLDLARISRTELQRQRLDLAELARRVHAELSAANPTRRIEFAAPESLWVEADPYLSGILLDNLLGNAWKFTARTPSARIEFGLADDGGPAAFFVRDNGIGFDMAYSHQLFGAFQRLHDPDEFPGTGIGLATVARVVKAHRGQIWAEAQEGEGATFYFTLGEETLEPVTLAKPA